MDARCSDVNGDPRQKTASAIYLFIQLRRIWSVNMDDLTLEIKAVKCLGWEGVGVEERSVSKSRHAEHESWICLQAPIYPPTVHKLEEYH